MALLSHPTMSSLQTHLPIGREESQKIPLQCHALEPQECFRMVILSQLKDQLPPLWVTVLEDDGINVLLLSRDCERLVQRRLFFSFRGKEEIFVHRKQICGFILESVLQPKESQSIDLITEQGVSAFVSRVVTVVKRLQGYEVCMGVHEIKYKPLWTIDRSGDIDKNPYGEKSYTETFRPFACHILVSTMNYTKRRCPVCIQAKIKFRVRLKRHMSENANPKTPNVYLDRSQLLNKINLQQKQLKNSRAQLDKLKASLRRSLLRSGVEEHDFLSEEILKICMSMVCTSREIVGDVSEP